MKCKKCGVYIPDEEALAKIVVDGEVKTLRLSLCPRCFIEAIEGEEQLKPYRKEVEEVKPKGPFYV